MKTSTFTEMARMAWAYMSGRKLRTLLTTIAIVFGVMLIFMMNLILPAAMDSFKRMMLSTSGVSDLVITSVGSESFDGTELLAKAATVDGVKAVSGALRRQYTVPVQGTAGAVGTATQIEVTGIDPATIDAVRPIQVSDGRMLTADDHHKVLMPAIIKETAPDIKVGTKFPLITAAGLKAYEIVGFVSTTNPAAAPTLVMTLADAQEMFNQPGLINTVEVTVNANTTAEAVIPALKEAIGKNFSVNAAADAADAFSALGSAMAIFNLLGAFALFLGGFLIFNTFRTVVVERQHDLGMLRAIGATRNQVMQMIIIEGVLQGVLGTVIGLIIGYLLAMGAAAGFRSVTETFIRGLNFSVTLRPDSLIIATALGLITTLVAVYFPARAAAKVLPIEALRPATTTTVKRAARRGLIIGSVIIVLSILIMVASKQAAIMGALLILVGIVMVAPALVTPATELLSPLMSLGFAREGDLARSNLVRQPGRAAITAGTLMIGLAVFIAIAGLVVSFDGFVTGLVKTNFTSDIMIIPPAIGIYSGVLGTDEGLNDKLRGVDGVQAVAGMSYAASTIGKQAMQILGIDPQEYPKLAPFQFNTGDADSAFSAMQSGRVLIMNGIAASTLKVKTGDKVMLQTPNGEKEYTIAALATDVLTMKVATAYISQENMKADFNKAENVMVMLDLKDGVDPKAVLPKINEVLKDYPQMSAKITGEYREFLLTYTVSALKIFYVLAFLIIFPAALGLLNTLTINVLERTREIGVTRAIGASRGQVSRIVLAEALLLGLFGVLMGIVAGIALSYGFTSAISNVGWILPYSVPIGGIIGALIVSVILALLAAILPARSAARMDIMRALQYE